MAKLIISILLIIVSVLSFVFYTKGAYADVRKKTALINKFDFALKNAKRVQQVRDELLNQRTTLMTQEQRDKLQKMLPVGTVDNIQLFLDIEGISKRYDMRLENINISSSNKNKKKKKGGLSPLNIGQDESNIKNIEVSFNVISSYDDFIKFIQDLEHSLRIVDIVSIGVSAQKNDANSFNRVSGNTAAGTDEEGFDTGADINAESDDYYNFQLVLRTYWLSN